MHRGLWERVGTIGVDFNRIKYSFLLKKLNSNMCLEVIWLIIFFIGSVDKDEGHEQPGEQCHPDFNLWAIFHDSDFAVPHRGFYPWTISHVHWKVWGLLWPNASRPHYTRYLYERYTVKYYFDFVGYNAVNVTLTFPSE